MSVLSLCALHHTCMRVMQNQLEHLAGETEKAVCHVMGLKPSIPTLLVAVWAFMTSLVLRIHQESLTWSTHCEPHIEEALSAVSPVAVAERCSMPTAHDASCQDAAHTRLSADHISIRCSLEQVPAAFRCSHAP